MKEAGPLFEEPWPDEETGLVIDAVRAAVTGHRRAAQDRLAEAGRRWARAHQSASLMRTRLSALEASMEGELGDASEADRVAYYRAWRTVTDAATWTSLTQLEEAALVDPLTEVGNRRALDLMLTRAMSGARRAGSELVVVAVDLDGLKRINDSQGHAEGDRTLTSLVNAFGERLRASDTVFRTGGDEFAVVLPGMGLGDVEPLMHRISAGGAPGFTWGAAAFGLEHQHPSDLLEAADTDLYRRRGVERDGAASGTAVEKDSGGGEAAGAGATIVGLRHPNGWIRTPVSHRSRLALAAGLVAIAGTLGAVTPLSPANHAALPPRHPGTPAGRSGQPVGTPPTTTPPLSTPAPTTPTPTPATSGASTDNIRLADVSTPGPSAGTGGITATPATDNNPPTAAPPTPVSPYAGPPSATPPSATPPSASPPTTVPPSFNPPTTVPASGGSSDRKPTLPPRAAAAQAEHGPTAHIPADRAPADASAVAAAPAVHAKR